MDYPFRSKGIEMLASAQDGTGAPFERLPPVSRRERHDRRALASLP
jgi:hypothetical protein